MNSELESESPKLDDRNTNGSGKQLEADLKAIIQEKEDSTEVQPKPKLFLEIGPWLSSTALRGNRHFTGNNVYIGLEKTMANKELGAGNYDNYAGGLYEGITRRPGEQYENKEYKSTTARNKDVAKQVRPGENINFLYGDMGHIPLPDASVHEIFAGNVFGHSRGRFERALDEISRVAQIGAKLIIKETTTPYPPEDFIGKPGQLYGDFVIERIIYGDSPQYEEMNREFGDNMEDIFLAKEQDTSEKTRLLHFMYYVELRKASSVEAAQIWADARAERREQAKASLQAANKRPEPDLQSQWTGKALESLRRFSKLKRKK